MDSITLIGLAAAVFTTAAFLPQAIKTVKTKNTKDLSLGMYIIFIVGITLWLTYGILISNLPIILANSITIVLAGIILFMKIKYK